MPKHEPMTPKAIGKAIKSKGLQKLKFFCQMCQKQCRDANGFKCHTTSEAHQRQLLLFAENPGRYLDGFSGEFLKDFLYLLRTRFGTRRVHANQVYQEYIKERNHVHMNSTRWLSLTGLSKWLGRKGICEVDQTERGWFITYIDRDPETLKKQENAKSKVKMEKDYEERMAKIIAEQVERGKQMELARQEGRLGPTGDESNGESDTDEDEDQDLDAQEDQDDSSETKSVRSTSSKRSTKSDSSKPKDLVRSSEDEKITFALPGLPVSKRSTTTSGSASSAGGLSDLPLPQKSLNSLESAATAAGSSRKRHNSGESTTSTKSSASVKKSALDELIQERELYKEKLNRKDYWLAKGLVVKIISKKVPAKYYKSKAVVKDLIDRYTAQVEILDDSGDVLKVDQSHVETVIPKPGNAVRVVNGAYRDCNATLLEVDFDKFCAKIRIDSGPTRDRIVSGVAYEDICKKYSKN